MADESPQIATENLKRASAIVTKIESEYDKWNSRVESNINNPEKLTLCITERDKAYVRLKGAQEDLNKLLNPQASNEFLQEIKQIKLTLDTFSERFANLDVTGSSSRVSDTEVGKRELDRLKKLNLKNEVYGAGDPFWSQVHQDNANAITIESVFIAYITPFFSDIAKSYDMVFVNSEEHGWLPQSIEMEKKLKGLPPSSGPDGFLTHRGMFSLIKEDNGRLFGEAVKELFDCIILFEGKLKIHDAGFAQVMRYLNHLDRKGSTSAILFDRTSFWMITAHRGVVAKVETMDWVAHGSKNIFQNFIIANKSPWISRLQEACNIFNVHIVDNDKPFLGRGAIGRVFKVVRGNEEFALKIAEPSSTRYVHREMDALRNAEKSGLTIKLIEGCVEYSNGVAMLLSPVGSPVEHPTTKENIVKLFQFLHQLHDQNLFHGDPRIPNVICHNNQLIWIDLVEVFDLLQHDSSYLRYEDITTLTRSILRKPHKAELGKSLESLMTKYFDDASEQNLKDLADEVYQHIPKK